jgi:beta-lactam-binding protein with PASTA domain
MSMANQQNSPDPYQRHAENAGQRTERLDDKLQPNTALAREPARGARMALYAIAIVVVLGALFYGFNTSTEKSATAPQSTSPSTAQNNTSKPPVAPGVRDVTPSNTQPGVTTGSAPANSTQPANPQSDNAPAPRR